MHPVDVCPCPQKGDNEEQPQQIGKSEEQIPPRNQTAQQSKDGKNDNCRSSLSQLQFELLHYLYFNLCAGNGRFIQNILHNLGWLNILDTGGWPNNDAVAEGSTGQRLDIIG